MSILDKLFGESDTPRDHPAKPDAPMKKVLDELASLNPKPIETLSPEEARRQPTPTDAVKSLLRKAGKDPADDLGVKTTDITIPGAAGPLQARIYKPHAHSEDKLHPVVVYFHGGGFVIADLDVYDGGPRGVSKMADVIVVSVHYRQAPEQFPAAHDDALAAYRWVLDNAQSFHGDPQKVAVMGESAGGNLPSSVSLMARDAGLPAPVHQVLVYPVAGVDMDNASYVENATAKPLNKPMMQWFVKHIFENEGDAQDPRINLVENADLIGLPSSTVICAEIDPLRSEGELLAEKLEQAGVDVRQKTFHGSTHEFFGMAQVLPDAMAAQTFAAHELKRAFGTAILPI
ncbi:alpha/beta hydrolase [Brevundimonas albigilva]|uniref:alpha/beta hydrolase n=1 Tax=Brevundimonas albigilva TaxID=1312364 RepID=UPI00201B9568|nr:alpha/beta hydrolase [Brevundimonas albigilva]UQV17919.1 alpha/beta hydrolase [Brevundimonas albigilva]